MPGTYTITETEQSGWIRTAPVEGSYTIDALGCRYNRQGLRKPWILGHIRKRIPDSNGNGAKDGDETGQAGWSIQLSQNGNIINATTTGQDGSYAFKNLAPGKYTVSEVAMEGWTRQPARRGIIQCGSAECRRNR